MRLTLRTDRRLLRSTDSSTRYLLISTTAPTAPPREGRLPVTVGLVLDRSGSMDGERKFELAREAVEQSLRLLRPTDRFTLVVYDTEVDVLVPATLATAEARHLALSRLRGIGPRGGTDLHAGWTAAAQGISGHLAQNGVTRVLLLTDGLANSGVSDPGSLVAVASDLRRRAVTTSTFGVGADFDERLLRDIAHEGGGNFYFIETPTQIADLLTSELGEALEVVVRDAVLCIDLPRGAHAEPLNRYRFAAAGHELRVDLGDLTSGQDLHLAIRIRFAPGEIDAVASVAASVVDGAGRPIAAPTTTQLRYASDSEVELQPRDRVVDLEVAMLYAAHARAEATERNRADDLRGARRILEQTAWRIRGYAGDDPEIEAIWRAIERDIEHFGEGVMSAMQLKSAFFVAESTRRNRGHDGKARRSPPASPS